VLQSHVLRAGWSKGVTGWGVLGVGSQPSTRRAPVASSLLVSAGATSSYEFDDPPPPPASSEPRSLYARMFYAGVSFLRSACALLIAPSLLPDSSSGLWHALLTDKSKGGGGGGAGKGRAMISVPIECGTQPDVLIDQAALSRWSVDAIRLVRHQLNRAGGGVLPPLCYGENWGEGESAAGDGVWDLDELNSRLPSWAEERGGEVAITDVVAMCEEVDGIVDCMDDYMQAQSERRLGVLKPPSPLARSWYLFAVGVPAVCFGVYQCFKHQDTVREMASKMVEKGTVFFVEHLKEPIEYM
jgi:hypothetical protein